MPWEKLKPTDIVLENDFLTWADLAQDQPPDHSSVIKVVNKKFVGGLVRDANALTSWVAWRHYSEPPLSYETVDKERKITMDL